MIDKRSNISNCLVGAEGVALSRQQSQRNKKNYGSHFPRERPRTHKFSWWPKRDFAFVKTKTGNSLAHTTQPLKVESTPCHGLNILWKFHAALPWPSNSNGKKPSCWSYFAFVHTSLQYHVSRCTFMSRTIVPNFIPIRFVTTEP